MRTRVLLLMAAIALIASGCFKAEFTIDVNDDGSGTVEGITALNFEAVSGLLEGFGEDAGFTEDDICNDFDTGDLSDLDDTRPYNEDGFCGVQFSSSFTADEFSGVAAALGDGSGDDAVLRQEPDGGWFFELQLDASDFSTEDAAGLPGFEDILGDAEYIMRVRLPGRQVDHNGDINADGFVVWDVDITNPPSSLFVRTEPGERITGSAQVGGGDDGGGNTVVVIIIVVAVLAALGLAAFFLMRNRGGNEDPPASGIAATVPGGGAPTMPPVDPNAPATNAAPPVDATRQMPVADMPTTADMPQAPAPEPAGATSPTPEEATGAPVWDPVRGKYVQWDPNANHWLVFDDATQSWNVEGS